MSPENLKMIAHLELKISEINLISVRKWGNEQTDRHTRFLELFGTSVGTSQECIQKISEGYIFFTTGYLPILTLFNYETLECLSVC